MKKILFQCNYLLLGMPFLSQALPTNQETYTNTQGDRQGYTIFYPGYSYTAQAQSYMSSTGSSVRNIRWNNQGTIAAIQTANNVIQFWQLYTSFSLLTTITTANPIVFSRWNPSSTIFYIQTTLGDLQIWRFNGRSFSLVQTFAAY